jgi:hypothetical protein
MSRDAEPDVCPGVGSRTNEPSPMTSSYSLNGARAESWVGSKPI